MKFASLLSAAAFAVLASVGSASSAGTTIDASCNVNKPGGEVSYREAHDVYLCLERKMFDGYNTGPKRWINANHVGQFRTWDAVSTLPANPGVHSFRFLFTYANPIASPTYKKYADGITMPVGSVLAKESFQINKKGKAKPGPLFIMEKVAPGTSPKTGDWFYTLVNPNGTPAAINVFKACHECHSGFEDSDFMGYPVEEVRRK